MKLYRFSPIKNEKELVLAVKYVAQQSTKLCKKIIGKKLPIISLTIFSHYENEYEKLIMILKELGSKHGENNGLRIALKKPIKVSGHIISYLRIRRPDTYRMQVGCCDFEIEYKGFKKNKFPKSNLRLIERKDYDMIEFFHPDFDVLAYVVSKKI